MKHYKLAFILPLCLFACTKQSNNEDKEDIDSTKIVNTIDTMVQPQRIGIKMIKSGGVYEIPCYVNGVKMNFIFDTGASDVCISLTEALFLYKNGYIDDLDIGEKSYSQVADGRITTNTKLNIKTIEIAGITLHDIDALVVSSLDAPLLLGQSALQQLGHVEIVGDSLFIGETNNDRPTKELKNQKREQISTLEYAKDPTWWDKLLAFFGYEKKIDKYVNLAYKAYKNDLPDLALSYCHKASYCKSNWKSAGLIGLIDHNIGCLLEYKKLNKSKKDFIFENGDTLSYVTCIIELAYRQFVQQYYSASLETTQELLAFYPNNKECMNLMGCVYTVIGDYTTAEKWAKKLFEIDEKAEGYFRLGNIAEHQGRLNEAAKNYEKCLEITPQRRNAKNNLANVYIELGNYSFARQLKIEAAREGNQSAQKWCKEKKIDW